MSFEGFIIINNNFYTVIKILHCNPIISHFLFFFPTPPVSSHSNFSHLSNEHTLFL